MLTGRIVKPSDLHFKYYANAAHRSKLLQSSGTSSRILERICVKWMGFNINLSLCVLNRKRLFTLQKLFIGYTC